MSNDDYWTLALVIGLVAALIVAVLLLVPDQGRAATSRARVDGLLEVAGKVAGNTANIPQLEATAPVLGLIVDEAVVQDGYMNALTDGYGGHELSMAAAPDRPARRRRRRRARRRADRGPPQPAQHLATGPRDARATRSRPSSPSTCARSSRAVKAINAQFDVILARCRASARKAAIVAERRPR